MTLQLNGRIGTGNDLLDADLRDIRIVAGPGGTFLYAATGLNGGISVYRVDSSGSLASLSSASYYAISALTMGSFDLIDIDGAPRLALGNVGDGALVSYGITANGALTGMGQNDLPGSGIETARTTVSHTLSNGTTALYMVDGDTGALAAYVSNGAGVITALASLSGRADLYDLSGAVALETATAGGVSFLLAADSASGSVRSYRVDTDSGALQYTGSLGAANGLGVAMPSALQSVSAYGSTWVILAASGSGSLSVMKLLPTGQLEPADHILDTLATRFGGVAALEVVEVQGHVFVLAGGSDDGLALFSLLPDGRLVHMQSLAHFAGVGLMNVTGIEAVQMGSAIKIFVTSGGDTGISQFSLPLDDLGVVIQGSGGQVLGTAAHDTLVGGGTQDWLMGQGGDDILVSGSAGGTLSGGAGADIFVLSPTTDPLLITDFEPGLDRLDLTQFPMLRGLSQLGLTTTGSGIEIRYRDTLISILSRDGQPLTAADLWPVGFDTPDRVPIPDGPVIRITWGTAADDILTLGPGQDIVHGMGGDDQLRGMSGADRLLGGAGGDQLFGGNGRDTLSGGKGNDLLQGGAGNDTLKGGEGGDTLWGGDREDILRGEAGNDRLFGGNGVDVLKGGTGDDDLYGDAGNDRLYGGLGDDDLFGHAWNDGGTASRDRAYFDGNLADFTFETKTWFDSRRGEMVTQLTVTDSADGGLDGFYEGKDRLMDIDQLVFGDQTVAFDDLL